LWVLGVEVRIFCSYLRFKQQAIPTAAKQILCSLRGYDQVARGLSVDIGWPLRLCDVGGDE
jgi:hypothetical protein